VEPVAFWQVKSIGAQLTNRQLCLLGGGGDVTACVGFCQNLPGVVTVLSRCALLFLHDAVLVFFIVVFNTGEELEEFFSNCSGAITL
jgi:hypothetical protein